ncbi:uncharacterized protein LOC110460908 [Mizuhopecten yessoensis]|uniref:uncharacterized protein LOC110460908 n=1 Tax=Mizuhopecten yessoensis TaxID=6573 RepID=UPI000B459388|nr:uncharacterized protein LOC110460908 [Mizuhopecten yessoensis]XP_021369792.1 uncharacterized protein LOC110460908 [Mizuhopecten yessoensis]
MARGVSVFKVFITALFIISQTTELRPYITKENSNLSCFECPPGFYLSGDCTTNNTIAACRVCPQGYYSSVPGVHTSCAICSSFCESNNLIVVSSCSSTNNLTCDCPSGKVLKDPHDKHHAICEDPPTHKPPKTTQNYDYSIVKEDTNALKEDAKTLKENVRAMNVDVGTMKEDVGRLKEDVGAVKEGVGRLKEDVGAVKEGVSSMKDTLNALSKDISYIEDDYSIVKEDTNALKEDAKTLKENVRAMKDDVGTMKEDVGRLKEDVGAMKEDASSMKDTLNALSKEISHIKDLTIAIIILIVVVIGFVLGWFVIRCKKYCDYLKRTLGKNEVRVADREYSELPKGENNQDNISNKENSHRVDKRRLTNDELPPTESDCIPKTYNTTESDCIPKTNNTYDVSVKLEMSNIALGSTVNGDIVGNGNC